ncbi:MAG TPA: phosphate ABC transporter permease subunit PstC [Bacteroidales bacterium]|nr:phosphate ABC transporter permease subunit PstC [Bacteroidales bacterium]
MTNSWIRMMGKKQSQLEGTITFNKKKFRFSDWFAEKAIKVVAFLSIAIVILIFIFVFREAFPIFRIDEVEVTTTGLLVQENYGSNEDVIAQTVANDAQLDNSGNNQEIRKKPSSTLLSKTWMPVSDNPRYGLWPLFLGTLKVTLISLLFAAPISILAAIYTAVFAKPVVREIIKPVIELLAGFPSVVIGFFALMILATLFQNIFGYASRLNSFVGGIAMGLAAITVIFTLTEDALTAVPKTYTEASLGLGASRRQTAFYVVLPAAVPGIFAAVVLGVGRIFGETMIALMATGNAAMISMNPFDSVRTLSATIGAEMAEVVFGDTHYSVLFLIGSLLFIFTFILNALAEFYFKNRIIRHYQAKK